MIECLICGYTSDEELNFIDDEDICIMCARLYNIDY